MATVVVLCVQVFKKIHLGTVSFTAETMDDVRLRPLLLAICALCTPLVDVTSPVVRSVDSHTFMCRFVLVSAGGEQPEVVIRAPRSRE